MVSLPLALVGALLGLVVTGYHLSLGAMIGIILLMGLVTKNAILLVDGALQHLRAGDSVDEALLKAGPRRLRPILMTSAAMAIGMVPTAMGKGLGSEFRAPMAIAVIGGVITSTFLTLLVVPVVFAGMERVGFFRSKKQPRRSLLPSLPPAQEAGSETEPPEPSGVLSTDHFMNTPSLTPRGASGAATHARRVSLFRWPRRSVPLAAGAQASRGGPSPLRLRSPRCRRWPWWRPRLAGAQVSLKEALVLAAKQSPDIAAARAQARGRERRGEPGLGGLAAGDHASGQLVHTSAPAELDLGHFVGPGGRRVSDSSAQPGPYPAAGHHRRGELALRDAAASPSRCSPRRRLPDGPRADGQRGGDARARKRRASRCCSTWRARTWGSRAWSSSWRRRARRRRGAQAREGCAGPARGRAWRWRCRCCEPQTETAQARSQLAQLAGQHAQLLAMLEALVGEPVRPLPAGASGVEWGAMKDEQAQPWEQTYSVRSAAKVLEAATGVLQYDRFAWLPSVAAVGKGNYNSNAGFSGRTASYDVLLAVSVPLYDRGLRYAAKHEDEAKVAQAKAQLDASRARARATWVAARANLEAAQAALTQAEAQAQLAARAQKQVEASAKAGVVTNLELSDADSRRFLAASAAAQSRAAVDIRRAELAAAEGQLAVLVQAE